MSLVIIIQAISNKFVHVTGHMSIQTVPVLYGLTEQVRSDRMGILLGSDFHTVLISTKTKAKIRNQNDFILK